jgi:hypothetical protein
LCRRYYAGANFAAFGTAKKLKKCRNYLGLRSCCQGSSSGHRLGQQRLFGRLRMASRSGVTKVDAMEFVNNGFAKQTAPLEGFLAMIQFNNDDYTSSDRNVAQSTIRCLPASSARLRVPGTGYHLPCRIEDLVTIRRTRGRLLFGLPQYQSCPVLDVVQEDAWRRHPLDDLGLLRAVLGDNDKLDREHYFAHRHSPTLLPTTAPQGPELNLCLFVLHRKTTAHRADIKAAARD